MEVGLKIKDYLNNNGISQAYIARETNIPIPKLNLALNGNRKLTFEEYELICGALDLNTDFFLKPRKQKISD
ncbi:MAG: helix-turn-helix transcriptional regulator [Eubacteriales bacterium]|nr:helix-turn-helix transcriptional regulator [Eubacteriales bacterium]